jgi:3-hydroxybutyryl-CoA dehydrogenase
MNVEDIKTVGVVGCGQMGAGIVESFARAGYTVIAREPEQALIDKGLAKIKGSLGKGVERGKLAQADMDAALARISGTIDLAAFAPCDLVVEAIVENMDAKREVFAALDRICGPHAILASNTSSLNITQLGAVTKRPDQVVGLHFFNPVPVMPLIEIVRALLTNDETMELARALGPKLGKQIVIAKDRPGFIVNLLLVPYVLDAIRWYDAGLATREDIDTAIKLGLNHPMGPLTLSDFIGLDTILFISDAMYDELKDSRYAAPPLLRRMVLAGLLGRKVGKGFYQY